MVLGSFLIKLVVLTWIFGGEGVEGTFRVDVPVNADSGPLKCEVNCTTEVGSSYGCCKAVGGAEQCTYDYRLPPEHQACCRSRIYDRRIGVCCGSRQPFGHTDAQFFTLNGTLSNDTAESEAYFPNWSCCGGGRNNNVKPYDTRVSACRYGRVGSASKQNYDGFAVISAAEVPPGVPGVEETGACAYYSYVSGYFDRREQACCVTWVNSGRMVNLNETGIVVNEAYEIPLLQTVPEDLQVDWRHLECCGQFQGYGQNPDYLYDPRTHVCCQASQTYTVKPIPLPPGLEQKYADCCYTNNSQLEPVVFDTRTGVCANGNILLEIEEGDGEPALVPALCGSVAEGQSYIVFDQMQESCCLEYYTEFRNTTRPAVYNPSEKKCCGRDLVDIPATYSYPHNTQCCQPTHFRDIPAVVFSPASGVTCCANVAVFNGDIDEILVNSTADLCCRGSFNTSYYQVVRKPEELFAMPGNPFSRGRCCDIGSQDLGTTELVSYDYQTEFCCGNGTRNVIIENPWYDNSYGSHWSSFRCCGFQLVNSSANEQCCNERDETSIITRTIGETCCSRNPVREGQGCCPWQSYGVFELETHACCPNLGEESIYLKTEEACCGGSTDVPYAKVPANGIPFEHRSCCRTPDLMSFTPYNNVTHTCCDNFVRSSLGLDPMLRGCCNGVVYDISTGAICCGGTVHEPMGNLVYDSCCVNEPIDSNQQSCCPPGRVIPGFLAQCPSLAPTATVITPAPPCPDLCAEHGVCRGGGTCDCDPGFAGPDCSTPLCGTDCGPGGKCLFNSTFNVNHCQCNETLGYQLSSVDEENFVLAGAVCQPICRNVTCGPGRCVAPELCSCSGTGYMGRQCETPICLEPCLNGGVCIAPLQCQCDKQFSGPTCQYECPFVCQNGGRCVLVTDEDGEPVESVCDCRNTGFSGNACENDLFGAPDQEECIINAHCESECRQCDSARGICVPVCALQGGCTSCNNDQWLCDIDGECVEKLQGKGSDSSTTPSDETGEAISATPSQGNVAAFVTTRIFGMPYWAWGAIFAFALCCLCASGFCLLRVWLRRRSRVGVSGGGSHALKSHKHGGLAGSRSQHTSMRRSQGALHRSAQQGLSRSSTNAGGVARRSVQPPSSSGGNQYQQVPNVNIRRSRKSRNSRLQHSFDAGSKNIVGPVKPSNNFTADTEMRRVFAAAGLDTSVEAVGVDYEFDDFDEDGAGTVFGGMAVDATGDAFDLSELPPADDDIIDLSRKR